MCYIFLVHEISMRPTCRLRMILLLITVLQVVGAGERVLFVTGTPIIPILRVQFISDLALNLTFPITAHFAPY